MNPTWCNRCGRILAAMGVFYICRTKKGSLHLCTGCWHTRSHHDSRRYVLNPVTRKWVHAEKAAQPAGPCEHLRPRG